VTSYRGYGSRFAPKPTGARVGAAARPAGRTLAENLRDPAALLRIAVVWDQAGRPRWTVTAWTERFDTTPIDPATQQQLLTWLRETHPAVNWWLAHDYDLRTGRLGAAPGLLDAGFIPCDDRTFGEERPPVLADERTPAYPWAVAETLRRAA